MLRLHEDKYSTLSILPKAHADQLAAKLGRNRSAHEILGRFVRVTTKMAKQSTGLP